MRILVTGADGFIGRHVISELTGAAHTVVGLSRGEAPHSLIEFHRKEINSTTDYGELLVGTDVVVHLAASTQSAEAGDAAALEKYREINTRGTVNLAEQAARAHVKQFVFMSSIKVNGESTQPGEPFTASSPAAPEDAYGISKFEAEQGLLRIAERTSMAVTIVRSPIVYGPGVKGNFDLLLKLALSGLPLPMGSIADNRRSYVFVKNLTSFISRCIGDPVSRNRVFVISDGRDVSTSELVTCIAETANSPTILLPVPLELLRWAGALLRREQVVRRLVDSLQVDSSDTQRILNWTPPFTVEEGLRRTISSQISPIDRKRMRQLDIALASIALFVASPLMAGVAFFGLFDTGSPLFAQTRMGKNQKPFTLYKFRTMRKGTVSVASHLADTSSITRFGRFLRKTKLDELPQLLNVLKGDMSFIGPRPNLFNQEELIRERAKRNVYDAAPGITGLAQVSGIDMATPALLAETDKRMIDTLCTRSYLNYLLMTMTGKGSGDAATRIYPSAQRRVD